MDAALFVRTHTAPAKVPLVPEIRLYTASELTPVWKDVDDVPFWCVPWAGGQALARYVLDHPEIVRGKRVLDVGTGGGVVAIAAKLAGAAHVLAVDIDPVAIAACSENARLNGVEIAAEHGDPVGWHVDVDILLAGDIWYEREPAERFEAWLRALPIPALTGDPGRTYVPRDVVELARYEVPTTMELEGATRRTTRVLTLAART
jgi:predicted nicotinamide N-methyase